MKLLQVGDRVYRKNAFSGALEKYEIDRVTKTLAIAGNTRFKRTYGSQIVYTAGSSQGFRTTLYRAETPDLAKEFEIQELRRIITDRIPKLSLSELRAIKIGTDQCE